MNWIDEIRIFEIILPSLKNKLQARDKEIARLGAELSFTKQELGAADLEIKRLKKQIKDDAYCPNVNDEAS